MINLRKILIIDDDKISIFIAKRVITMANDTNIKQEIIETLDAEEALNIVINSCTNHAIKDACPDLIIIDLHMPKMDADELLSILENKYCEAFKKTIWIGITSHLIPQVDKKMKENGLREIIIKPITVETMTDIMNKYFS